MIRIRGPVGTLRVLMLPGESDPCPQGAEEACPRGAEERGAEASAFFREETGPFREGRHDQ